MFWCILLHLELCGLVIVHGLSSQFAEEESKRKMQEKLNVAKQKKQKKKAKKKSGRDGGVTNVKASPKHSEVEADPRPDVAAPETKIEAHGQTYSDVEPARTDISDHVLNRLHGGQNYRQSTLHFRLAQHAQ